MWLLTKLIELVEGIYTLYRKHFEFYLYKGKTRNVPCKSIIVRFLTFRHRTLFYRNRNKLKNAKVRLDLTKKRYKIFTDANDFVKIYKNVDYVMVDINCRLEVFFKNGRSNFFDNISDLNNLIVEENTE